MGGFEPRHLGPGGCVRFAEWRDEQKSGECLECVPLILQRAQRLDR